MSNEILFIRFGISFSDENQEFNGKSNDSKIQYFHFVKDQKTLDILNEKKAEVDKLDLDVKARILIVSSWKNGCDLIGDILAQHPGTFYHYEPLAWRGIKRFVNDVQDELATNILSSQFKCKFGASIGKSKIHFLNVNLF